MRSRISPAALFVNVTARMRVGSTPWCSMRRAMRVVSTRVLPEPAPASTSSGPVDVQHGLALRGIQAARAASRRRCGGAAADRCDIRAR